MRRVVAMALAAVIVLGAGVGLTAKSAFAADPDITSKSIVPEAYTKDDSIKITLSVKDSDDTRVKGHNPVTTGATVTMASDSDFELASGGTMKVVQIYPDGVNKVASFKVELTGLKLKSGKDAKTAKVKFTVEDKTQEATNPSLTYNHTLSVPAASTASGGDSSSSTPTPPEISKSNANYTITKVAVGQRMNNTDKPGQIKFDIDNVTAGSDATIRQTYFVDMVIRVDDEAAPKLTVGDLQLGASGAIEMGSFVFDSASGATAKVTSSREGSYSIKFTNLRYTGNGKKLNFRVDQENYISDILVDSITECKTRQEQLAENDKNTGNDDDDDIVEAETPYVIVSKYGYGGGMVNAGQTFPLSMTFYNTSSDLRVTNMMITLTMPEGLMLTSSSNTFYVEELGTKSSITKSVQVTARPDAKVQSHNVGIAMKYQYVDPKANARRSAETSETVAIPLAQIDRFNLTSVEIPLEMMLEEENNVTVQFVNKGRSEVYNLTVSIEGDIANPGQQQNLGNLQSGATGSADFMLKANTAGPLRGTITATYEDTNMEEKTATIEYFTEVKTMEEMQGGGGMFPGGMNPGEMEPGMGEVTPEGKSKMPIYIGIGGAVALVAAVIIWKQIKRRRKEKEDADL